MTAPTPSPSSPLDSNPEVEARMLVAQAWCTKANAHKEMDSELANAVAEIFAPYIKKLRALLSQGADPGQPAAGLDALGQEVISAACLAYGVRGNGDKAPMIALDDAVRAYMAAPALVPAAPEAPVDILKRIDKHLTDWLDIDLCECEGPGHSCGKTEVRKTRDEVRALAAYVRDSPRSGWAELERQFISRLEAGQGEEGAVCPDCDCSPCACLIDRMETEGSASAEPQRAASGQIREKIAEACHTQWSGWMKYLFSKCEILPNADTGDIAVIPEWAVQRWKRQMDTAYPNLSEQEKGSDRKEADWLLALLGEAPPKAEQSQQTNPGETK